MFNMVPNRMSFTVVSEEVIEVQLEELQGKSCYLFADFENSFAHCILFNEHCSCIHNAYYAWTPIDR